MDGRLKSGEDIRAGDENILHTTALQAVEHERSGEYPKVCVNLQTDVR